MAILTVVELELKIQITRINLSQGNDLIHLLVLPCVIEMHCYTLRSQMSY